jgi:hypothetical protein
MRPRRLLRLAVVLVPLLVAGGGCKALSPERPIPLPEGADPDEVRDVNADPTPRPSLVKAIATERAEAKVELNKKQDLRSAVVGGVLGVTDQPKDLNRRLAPKPRYTFLTLSGGGADGAYSAGLMVGWTAAGGRPEFDIVTGVSTGALVAAAVFAGPEYDAHLQRLYTTVTTQDIISMRKASLPYRVAFSDGMGDNAPLRELLRSVMTPEYMHKVAGEHAKGRRLYVGTTNVDTRRFVIWDMGAIASRGTPESAELYLDVIVASTTFPGFIRPVRIPVDIDGQAFEELHVDGGATRSMFFMTPEGMSQDDFKPTGLLSESTAYAVVASKLYADPKGVTPRTLAIGLQSIGSMLDAGRRAEAFRLYSYCVQAGMDFKMAAIPDEFPLPGANMEFDPEAMTALFMTGYNQMACGMKWDERPPDFFPRDDYPIRKGTCLTTAPLSNVAPVTRRPPSPRLPARSRLPYMGP